jgi:predicted phosphodiesterase
VRIAALYDVHGNLPALEAVLADPRLRSADRIVVGGDLVAGPFPGECLERLRALDAVFIRGNGDRETVMPPDEGPLAEVARFARERLSDDQLAFVASWPLTVDLRVSGLGRTVFCHATPVADTAIVTSATPDVDVLAALGPVSTDVVVCGHTHVQFDRSLNGLHLVNAGSVGMPYEGSPDARWALLGHDVKLLATPYDASAALARLAATGYPAFEEWFVPALGREVTAVEATATFERRRFEETVAVDGR